MILCIAPMKWWIAFLVRCCLAASDGFDFESQLGLKFYGGRVPTIPHAV